MFTCLLVNKGKIIPKQNEEGTKQRRNIALNTVNSNVISTISGEPLYTMCSFVVPSWPGVF